MLSAVTNSTSSIIICSRVSCWPAFLACRFSEVKLLCPDCKWRPTGKVLPSASSLMQVALNRGLILSPSDAASFTDAVVIEERARALLTEQGRAIMGCSRRFATARRRSPLRRRSCLAQRLGRSICLGPRGATHRLEQQGPPGHPHASPQAALPRLPVARRWRRRAALPAARCRGGDARVLCRHRHGVARHHAR